jgi:hypothetical protein
MLERMALMPLVSIPRLCPLLLLFVSEDLNNFGMFCAGGKPDDITVLLATVAI